MNYDKIDTALLRTFDDFRLSKWEKYALRDILKPFATDTAALSFARNRAFDIARGEILGASNNRTEALRWLEHVVKSIDAVREDNNHEPSSAFFSPGRECKTQITIRLRQAQAAIDVCVFTISDDELAAELIAAHKRGVAVRIITDNDKANDIGSDIDRLLAERINLVMDDSPTHMHHKFAIIDGHTLINGSFNWTRSASLSNQENIMILKEPRLLDIFAKKFEELWQEFCQSGQTSA